VVAAGKKGFLAKAVWWATKVLVLRVQVSV
jgi:hypothetical protein